MIALGNATTTLTATLAGAKNTNDADVTCFFVDEPAVTTGVAVAVMDKQQSTTNGVAAATILSAGPAGVGFRRRLKSMTLFNADLAAITVSIKIVDTANSTTVLQKVTLQTLEQLNYEEGFGFIAIDVNGGVKSQAVATSSATSTAQLTASQASSMASLGLLGSSQASSLALAVIPTSVNSVSSQASAVTISVSTASSAASLGVLGSSQASSLASQNLHTVSSLQSAASVQSFTSTTWSTVSSANSRVKSSFTW